MNVRQFRTSMADLQLGYNDFVKSIKRADEMCRANIVMARAAGISTANLSQIYGFSETTIRSWVRLVDTDGWDRLRTCDKPGRPSRLTEKQIGIIDEAIQLDPENYGLCCWDGLNLADFIQANFEIQYSVRQAQKLLRKLDFTLLRPQLNPSKGEEDRPDRIEFIMDMRDIIDDGYAIVVFEDEVHFFTQPSVTRIWAKKGSKPKIKSPPCTEKVGYFGFATPETGSLHLVEKDKFNAETYIEAVRDFVRDTQLPEDGMILIVHDRATWHQKAARMMAENPKEYADITEKVMFLPLPSRSPDLNPIEQVWRLVRRECTHNRVFSSQGDLRERLERYTSQYASGSEKLQSLLSFKTYYAPVEVAPA